jgi:hypothetical protein
MGAPPEDYVRFQIAKYCNCKPWELPEIPLWWQQKALEYMNGEAEGQKILADRKK